MSHAGSRLRWLSLTKRIANADIGIANSTMEIASFTPHTPFS